jgi:hypothetical protein
MAEAGASNPQIQAVTGAIPGERLNITQSRSADFLQFSAAISESG